MHSNRVTLWMVKHMLNRNNALLIEPRGYIFTHLCTFGGTFRLYVFLALHKYIYALLALHLSVIFG